MADQTKSSAETERSRGKGKRPYLSQSDVPAHTLNDALRIPRALVENYAGESAPPLQVAAALDLTPTSGHFRSLCGAAIAYGLTKGGYNADAISLEPLGRRILTPTEEGHDLAARREAVLKPRIVREFLRKYHNSQLPQRRDIALNVLVQMGVPQDRVESVYELILENAQSVGFVTEIKGRQFVNLSRTEAATDRVDAMDDDMNDQSVQEPTDNVASSAKQERTPAAQLGQGIFIAHGKNKKPLEQLRRILDQFKIPYKVAVDEPNLGRPIGTKVKEIMESCNCAILIFTADEEFFDREGKSIWRPSENVVYELGASAYLYGSRIVILKEDGVQFPSNFQDLGYIPFEKDQLEAKSLEVLKELIGFGIVKITT